MKRKAQIREGKERLNRVQTPARMRLAQARPFVRGQRSKRSIVVHLDVVNATFTEKDAMHSPRSNACELVQSQRAGNLRAMQIL